MQHMLPLKPMVCRSALNNLSKSRKKLPYSWDLNIYRGCMHRCSYCYAVYSHKYLSPGGFYDNIYVKTNIAELLERELASPSWKREIVNIGGVTDCYQSAEAEYKIMPQVLKLFIKYKSPVIISTKSDLILRDYELIDQLSRVAYVNIASTITVMDEDVRAKMEPGAPQAQRRFEMLKAFSKTEASTGVHMMPIVPYITDSYENIDTLFACAKASGVAYLLTGSLYLRGPTRKVFFDFVKEGFPHLYTQLLSLYRNGSLDKDYKTGLYGVVRQIREKYSLYGDYSGYMREKQPKTAKCEQLTLF